MVGRAYKRLVDSRLQSLKPVFGKKLLGQLMLASNLLKKYLRDTINEAVWIQLDLYPGDKRRKIVTLANILKSY